MTMIVESKTAKETLFEQEQQLDQLPVFKIFSNRTLKIHTKDKSPIGPFAKS